MVCPNGGGTNLPPLLPTAAQHGVLDANEWLINFLRYTGTCGEHDTPLVRSSDPHQETFRQRQVNAREVPKGFLQVTAQGRLRPPQSKTIQKQFIPSTPCSYPPSKASGNLLRHAFPPSNSRPKIVQKLSSQCRPRCLTSLSDPGPPSAGPDV